MEPLNFLNLRYEFAGAAPLLRLPARDKDYDLPDVSVGADQTVTFQDGADLYRRLCDLCVRDVTGTGLGERKWVFAGPLNSAKLDELRALVQPLAPAKVQRAIRNERLEPGAEPLCLLIDDTHPAVRRLPLEVADWANEGAPACQSQRALVVRHSPDGRALVPDDSVRALVVIHDQQLPDPKVMHEFERALAGVADVLVHPSWAEVVARLEADARQYNVFAFVGHVHFDPESEEDPVGYCTFAGYQSALLGTAQKDVCIRPDVLAREVSARLPHLRCALLLGCETWPTVAAPFVGAGVPAVVGMQFTVADRAQTQAGAVAFLTELAQGGQVDTAFRALRGAFAHAVSSDHVAAAWPVLHLHGTAFEFLARDEETRTKIAYARKVVSELRYLFTFQGDKSADPRADCYLPRQVQYDEAQKPKGGEDKKEVEYVTRDAPEAWVLDRLTAGEGAVSLGVQAAGGAGKSTLLEQVAHALAWRFLADPLGRHRLPVLIPLGANMEARTGVAAKQNTNAAELVRAVLRHNRLPCADAPGAPIAAEWVFLFDGLDEMRVANRRDWGAPLAGSGPFLNPRTVAAGRPEAVPEYGLPHFTPRGDARDHILDLRPLAYPADVETFVDRFFARSPDAQAQRHRVLDALGRAPALQHAVALPFYLRLLCELVRGVKDGENDAALPETATGVFDEAVRRMCKRRSGLFASHLPALAALGFAAHAADAPLLFYDALAVLENVLKTQVWAPTKRAVGRSLRLDGAPSAPREVWERLRDTGLLFEERGGSDETKWLVGVRDPRVRTFLAARHLADLLACYEPTATVPTRRGNAKTVEAIVRRALGNPTRWRDVLVHLAGLLEHPERLTWLLGLLKTFEDAKDGTPAPFNPTLGLACRCCGELTTEQRKLQDVQDAVNLVATTAWRVVTPLSSELMRISPVARQIGHLINADAMFTKKKQSLLDLILDGVK